MKLILKIISVAAAAAMLASAAGCSGGTKVKLDPKKPVTISVWHYYNGATMNAFNELLGEFNESAGAKEGIIVEGYSMGNVSELEAAVLASANKEVGSQKIPNIFASYADTAYAAEQLGILADLDDYFTAQEQEQYIDSYIEEGKIGLNGELRIFPIAKSTEILMINDTDWQTFAEACGLEYGDIKAKEDIARIAKIYYEWTDSLTPDAPDDGKAFFGMDAFANLMIIGSKELKTEIFKVENGKAEINVDKSVMRRIWEYYYVPYISGYYASSGRYRSDDTKVGEIIAYIGSTASAAYFPTEVTAGGKTYPITSKILSVPVFENAENVMVQQGAGMVVVKGTPQEEYASSVFLKWFTGVEPNIRFSSMSGYMPVQKEANVYDKFMSVVEEKNLTVDDITRETLMISFDSMEKSEMYTNKAFSGGAEARAVLEHVLQDKAVADREAVLGAIRDGKTHAEAVAEFDNDENFENWLKELTEKLNNAAN